MMKKQIRVWFNHWFSTAYHIINLMRKENNYNFYFIGSNENRNSVVQLACNEWYVEPKYETEEQYLDYCLAFCREHQINVFVPRRGMNIISKNTKLFNEAGTILLLDNKYENILLFSDKMKTYRYFDAFLPNVVPKIKEVHSIVEFESAYNEISSMCIRVCMKMSNDEGASSFRVIDNSMDTVDGLYKQPGLKISYKSALQIIQDYDFSKPYILMPYLTGVEVSADCLSTPSGMIIVPRYKLGGRITEVRFAPDIISICEKFLHHSKLAMPCNLQFIYENHIPYLLEVNTRMSGGIQLSCLAANVNIPNIAINQLLGIDKEWALDTKVKKVSHIETPVLIREEKID